MRIFLALILLAPTLAFAQHEHSAPLDLTKVGKVHMDISCTPAASAEFDRALALLHNFWYLRAHEIFLATAKLDPECAMAYWGDAMTYNHPFWDAPSPADEAAAWTSVEKAAAAKHQSPREAAYVAAIRALYRDAATVPKTQRDVHYREAMAAAFAKFPDDETRLFYGLSILGSLPEGVVGFDAQEKAAALFEEVYKKDPQHPGALHYLIHADDDPVHAESGLQVAREYAAAAPGVPHALHMPSHIFSRLGYWEESARTNENAWHTSELDVARAHDPTTLRDFHSLTYLHYAYLELGRYRDARKLTGIIAKQYAAIPDKRTAPDNPGLQARHVRGRTIYALPDRVAYGYFDMLARELMETGDWKRLRELPLVAPSRDFVAMHLQLETTAAAARHDAAAARAAAAKLTALANAHGPHPFVEKMMAIQAAQAEAFAARAAGDDALAVSKLNDAATLEDSIESLSQPPYPAIPGHELLGNILLQMGRNAEAREQFTLALQRTPNRPLAIYGIARASEGLVDTATATTRYEEFVTLWQHADRDRPELRHAHAFLAKTARK
jgi:tetratricopeptide (TPR) repeat protein